MNMRGTVHYAPGDGPLCGANCPAGALTENPEGVSRCEPCLELSAEELADDNEYIGRCLHCRWEIASRRGVKAAPDGALALPALWEDRMVMNRSSTISEPQSPSQ